MMFAVGQTIEIKSTAVAGPVLVIDTDRTLAGQDGEPYSGVEAAKANSTHPSKIAVELFESDSAIDHVFVMSNTVSVRRLPSWSEESIAAASEVVRTFFRFYE